MKGKIFQIGIQHCNNCKKKTKHIPKMDAVKNAERVCDECRTSNKYYN